MGKAESPEPAARSPFMYGWFSFTPSCLQKINTPIWFLVFMCIANVFQSMTVNGLVGVVLSSLETRFGFPSTQSSWIASAYDVSTVPVLALLSYFGSRSHRPRWTGAGLFTLVLGTIIFVLPHFTTPAYRPDLSGTTDDDGLCDGNRANTSRCSGEEEAGSSLSAYLWVFIIGRVLHGIGAVPLYTIAVTYMDDTVSKEQFSLYIALFYAAGVLGPAFGYIVGGYMLTIYTDFYQVNTGELDVDSDSPQWVGAWWVGFLAGAIMLFLVTIPMSGYPRDLPGAAEVRASKVSEAYASSGGGEDDLAGDSEINVSWRELPRYFADLATNPTYVFLTLMVCCDSFLTGGFTAFGPKYVQEQFAVTAALSGMMFGIVVIPGGAGGTIVGGVLVKRMGLKCAGIMKGEMIFSILIMATGFMFFIVCDPLKFAGVTVGYNNTAAPDIPGYDWPCNEDCVCHPLDFRPVCSHDNTQYFSPCHAGCQDDNPEQNEYYNCSCISLPESVSKPLATSDHCQVPDCNLVPLFMVIFFFAMFFLFSCSAMNISATVRCLPATHRSLGIGVQWIFLRLLGTVPGPVAFGKAFDTSCQVWLEDDCGNRGQCLLYDKKTMALLLFAICVGIKLASLLFIILAWKLYKPPQTVDETSLVVNGKLPSADQHDYDNGGVVNTAYEPPSEESRRDPTFITRF